MGLYIGLGVVVALLVLLGFGVKRSGTRQETGVDNFRRHIDALSPEARREVQDRVRGSMPDRGNTADHGDSTDPREPR